jgi:hypothetical protein
VNKLAQLAIADVTKGAETVTLNGGGAAADAATISVGQMVWVRTTAERQFATWSIPTYTHFTRVLAKSGTNNTVITLADAVEENITGAFLSPVPPWTSPLADSYMGDGYYCAEDTVLRDFAVDAVRGFGRGMAYGLVIENIKFEAPVVWAVLCNGLQHTTIRNLTGYRYGRQLLEIKMSCRHLTVEAVRGRFVPISGEAVYYPLSVGENSRHIRLRELELDMPSSWPGGGYYPAAFQDCTDVEMVASTIRRGVAQATSGVNYMCYIDSGSTTLFQNAAHNIRLRGNTWDCGTSMGSGVFVIGNAARDIRPKGISIMDETVTGTLSGTPNWLNLLHSDAVIAQFNKVPTGAATTLTGGNNNVVGNNLAIM